MKPTSEQLRLAKDKLYAEIGSKTGISYVGIDTGELRVGYRPDRLKSMVPAEVDGIHVRMVVVGEIKAQDP